MNPLVPECRDPEARGENDGDQKSPVSGLEEEPARGGRAHDESADDPEPHDGGLYFIFSMPSVVVEDDPDEADPEVGGQSGQMCCSQNRARHGRDHGILQSADEAENREQGVIACQDQRLSECPKDAPVPADGDAGKDTEDREKGAGVARFLASDLSPVDEQGREHRAGQKKHRDGQHSEGAGDTPAGQICPEQGGESGRVGDKAVAGQVAARVDGTGLKGQGPPDGEISRSMFGEVFAGQHDADSV